MDFVIIQFLQGLAGASSLFLVAGDDTIITITNAAGTAGTGIPPIPLVGAAGAQIVLPPCKEGWGYSLSGLKLVSSQAVSVAGWINFTQK